MLLRPERAAMDEALDSGSAPATRGELRELAAAFGIERADEIAAGALVGLALQRDLSGGARSHLGAAPSLPADLSWPRVRDEDRPIAFMASIDCAELPDADGRELLPADGTLLFFADTAFGGAVHEGRGEPGTGGRIRVHHIPAGTRVEVVPPPPVLAEPDDEYGSTQVLERVQIIARPVLTLPEPWLAESRFALTAGESAAYVRLWERCSSALDDPAARGGLTSHHQILGHPESDPRRPARGRSGASPPDQLRCRDRARVPGRRVCLPLGRARRSAIRSFRPSNRSRRQPLTTPVGRVGDFMATW